MIEETIGTRACVPVTSAIRAPGRLESHYAPRAEVLLAGRDHLVRRLAELRAQGRRAKVLLLPEAPEEAARELYRALRETEASRVEVVLTALPPESGLGREVADCLRKAARPRG